MQTNNEEFLAQLTRIHDQWMSSPRQYIVDENVPAECNAKAFINGHGKKMLLSTACRLSM